MITQMLNVEYYTKYLHTTKNICSQRDETGSQHSSASSGGDSGGGKRRADGRKSSKPKKLRLNSAPAVAAPAPADTETSPPLPQLAQVTHYLARNTLDNPGKTHFSEKCKYRE